MLHSPPGVPWLFLRKDKECAKEKDKVQTAVKKAEGGARTAGRLEALCSLLVHSLHLVWEGGGLGFKMFSISEAKCTEKIKKSL